MRICLRQSFLCILILCSFCDKSESIFFGFPRRALMNILESLGGQKHQAKPIHHYHYYPVPVVLPKPAPPPKIEIDLSTLHSHHHVDHSTSYAWPHSSEFAKYHEPEFVAPPPLAYADPAWGSPDAAWAESARIQSKSYGWDNNELLEKDHTYKETAKSTGILLQVPLHQQIVLYQPPAKDKSSTLLSTLLKKLRRINDALFHPEEDDHQQHYDTKPHVSNTLNYATR